MKNYPEKYGYMLFCFLLLLIFASCQYSYKFTLVPRDAAIKINNESLSPPLEYKSRLRELTISIAKEGYLPANEVVTNKNPFKQKEVSIHLEKKRYKIKLDTIGDSSEFTIDNDLKGKTPAVLELTHDLHTIVLEREDFENQAITLDIKQEKSYRFRHQKQDPGIKPVGLYDCGSQPKQLIFSPDNRFIYITLLDGYGFQVFDVEKEQMVEDLEVKQVKKDKGFVEGLFIPEKSVFLLSQMANDRIYEYEYKDKIILKRSFYSGGRWPKIIAYAEKTGKLAVSNWVSNNVAIIDYKSGNVVHSVKNLKTPRGIAFTPDNKFMVVTSFNGGLIKKIETNNWKETSSIYRRSGAMRHVVISKDGKKCWVSDMYNSKIYEINMRDFKVTKSYPVFDNPNTIELTPDERFLFVSCRGPNNPQSYLLRSLIDGQVNVIDLRKQEVTVRISGGNQPTGLDVSSDGKYLCFSNFKDKNFEVYDISEL